jgi:hypothetical protein
MELNRLFDLIKRHEMLIPAEEQELNDHMLAARLRTFESCPICHGSFSQQDACAIPFHCPNCGIELRRACGDMLPHQENEVDSSTPYQPWLGEFAGWYYPAGCKSCNCMVLGNGFYPAQYSCCPGLLVLATKLFCQGTASQHAAASTFLLHHSASLINCLRGDYFKLFDQALLRCVADTFDERTIANTISEILGSVSLADSRRVQNAESFGSEAIRLLQRNPGLR